ncbi:MAG TPA: autotransporter domain-containing protein [Pseudomonadales bacterium]
MKLRYNILASAILLAASAGAQAQIYKGVLSGANEVPPVATGGSGVGVVSLNPDTHQLRVATTFRDLNSGTTAAHVHCCTAPGANAGVATMLPTFTGFPAGVTSGSYSSSFNTTQATTWNAAFIAANGGTPAGAEAALRDALNGGRSYLNIHTTTSPGGELRANLHRFSFMPAASGRTTSIAYALDALGAGDGAQGQSLLTLAAMDNAQLGRALGVLMPLPSPVVATTMFNGLFTEYDQISNRLGGLRGESENAHGVWVRYGDRKNEYDLLNRSATAESDSQEAGLGVDYQLESGLTLGIAVTLNEDTIDYAGAMSGTVTDLEGMRASLYAEQRFGAAFVEGIVTVAHSDIEYVRSYGAGNGFALAEDDADQYGMRLAFGGDMQLGESVRATPQVRFDYSNVDLGGYQESAANGLGLTVSDQDFDSKRVSVGAQIDWNISGGISPFLRGFWNAQVEGGDTFTNARFGNGPLFQVEDEGPGGDGWTAGIGVNFMASENLSAAISYDQTDTDDFWSEMVQARIMWRY